MSKFFQTSFFVLVFVFSTTDSSSDTLSRSLVVKKPDQKTALILGNAKYKTAPLKNPVNDARSLAQALKKVGFSVIHKENQTQNEMRGSIREFGRRIRQGGVGFFYYAGHGMQINGENYLIPVGNDIQEENEVPDQSVALNLVLRKMDAAKNKMNIVVLDACRDNPFARSFRSASKGLAITDGPTGTFIAYSTQPGATASDGDSGHGLYTQYLLKNIGTPGLTIEQVFKKVRTNVIRDSKKKQVPWELSSLTGEDFYFIKPGGNAVQVATLGLPDIQAIPDISEELAGLPSASEAIFGRLYVTSNKQPFNENGNQQFGRDEEEIKVWVTYENLPADTLIKGVWSDGGRSLELSQMFLVSTQANEKLFFSLKRPLEGFVPGNYKFDVFINEKSIGSTDLIIVE